MSAGYVDMHGACEFTSLSRRTIDYAKSRGELPHIRHGRKIVFSIDDLRAWIELGRVDVTAELEEVEGVA